MQEEIRQRTREASAAPSRGEEMKLLELGHIKGEEPGNSVNSGEFSTHGLTWWACIGYMPFGVSYEA